MARYADGTKVTKKQWAEIDAEINSDDPEARAPKLLQLVDGRLSRKRCKERLPQLVEAGVIQLTTPEALYAWTYGTAQVGGTRVEGVPGRKEAKINITKAQWDKVSKKKIADILRQAQTEKRAALCMAAILMTRKFRPTAEDIVFLTNERVTIEGVKVPERTRKQLDLNALIAGIE